MTALLHPTYFPNIAHFAIMAQRNFLFEKEDNYQKQTYRNRAYIYSANGPQMLSVPIKHLGGPQGHQKYKEVVIEDNFDWKKQHWKSIQTAYRTSPFFEYYEDELAPFFEKKHHRLFDMNLESIELIAGLLPFEPDFAFTAEYFKEPDKMNDLRPLVNAKKNTKGSLESYTQVFAEKHGYIENLSTLDLLFNEGPNALNYLERQAVL